MMPDREFDEGQERVWKRRRKPGRVDVGSIIKVKGEMKEKWKIRKIHVMKMGIPKLKKEGVDVRYCYRSKYRNASLARPGSIQTVNIIKTLETTSLHSFETPLP